ncbi:stalk domain-containing protein [Paenibacillus mendelii]|uniref:Stalk domain-containing protein n=1 Tax=Paenibacillus mendelii TaxID=206163 RepID=A0ABV6JGF7_9BACL|nr:stalk domain-containing protein [Paenibacillus mendelii]MCQ6561652.1 stalk domain-containing protein [Paenibacillus mendelii]
MRKVIVTGLIVSLFVLTAAVMPPAKPKPSGEGSQPIPLLMNNYFVLFPGDSAPYVKENRMMVPLRSFAAALGATIQYSGKEKLVQIRSSQDEAIDIRSGQPMAGKEEDLPEVTYPAPEVIGGTFFAPITPILQGLPSYRYELRSEGGRKVLAVMDPVERRLLPGIGDPDNPVYDYPHIMADPAYPFVPTALKQITLRDQKGRSSVQLSLTVDRVNGKDRHADDTIFNIIVKDIKGSVHERTIDWDGKATRATDGTEQISLDFTVPFQSSYVLFRATPIYQDRNIPVYPADHAFDRAMENTVVKLFPDQLEVLTRLGVEPIATDIQNHELIHYVRRIGEHREPLPAEEQERLKQAIYELTGRFFPLRIETDTINENKPSIAGYIKEIDKNGRILIENPDHLIGYENPVQDALWGSFTEDAVIIRKSTGEKMEAAELKAGMKVEGWTTGMIAGSYPGQGRLIQLHVLSDN